eukprot:2465497-Alexandrium_andersonii.AAC.1
MGTGSNAGMSRGPSGWKWVGPRRRLVSTRMARHVACSDGSGNVPLHGHVHVHMPMRALALALAPTPMLALACACARARACVCVNLLR